MPPSRPEASDADPAVALSQQRILKKYPNRRLYDTYASSYITLADVRQMVMRAQAFVVRDAKTGDDLTRSILLQIILEEEAGGLPMFSAQTLAQIIRFHGHAMQGMMGACIERNMQMFTDIQARVSEQTQGGLGSVGETGTEMWSALLSGQAPALQNMMSGYLEQSRQLFTQMQEKMAHQAETLFPGMPGFKAPKK